jgi:hypothetical protein
MGDVDNIRKGQNKEQERRREAAVRTKLFEIQLKFISL